MSERDYEKLRVEPSHGGSVLRVLLDDPPGNVLDSIMMESLAAFLDTLPGAGEAKVLIFEGAGEHFSYGASIEEHVKERAAAMLERFHGLFRRLAALGLPTISLVRGQCLGGGMELAIFSNLVVAEEGARFGQPEIKLGVFPPIAALVLALRTGQGPADRICLGGRSVDAREAETIGIVDHLVEAGTGDAFVASWVEKNMLPHSASSLRLAHRACRARVNRLLEQELPAIERLYLDELMETEDGNEGIASHMDGRKPVWKNR